VKVQQQPQRLAGGFEVGDHLGDVDGKDLEDRLELHHQLTSHHQVQLGCTNGMGAVADGDRYLPREGNAPVGQLQTESLLVDGFEETWTEGAMDLDRSADRLAGECVQLGAWFSDGPHPEVIV
jgi:hypothetical protein